MNRNPDTPALISVPGHTRLYRRHNGVYYLREKVPDDSSANRRQDRNSKIAWNDRISFLAGEGEG